MFPPNFLLNGLPNIFNTLINCLDPSSFDTPTPFLCKLLMRLRIPVKQPDLFYATRKILQVKKFTKYHYNLQELS